MIDGRDRRRLERLCRYVARPPVATERLTLLPDGRVRLAFKAPWRDGTDAVILAPLDFVARLCALVPPPRFHLVRYRALEVEMLKEQHQSRRVLRGARSDIASPGN